MVALARDRARSSRWFTPLVQSSQRPARRGRRPAAAAEAAAPAAAATPVPGPSPLRILGLLLLVDGGLAAVLDWSAARTTYGLMVQLIYPASLGVTLVLLFDKATRTWGIKGGAESRARMAACAIFCCFCWSWPSSICAVSPKPEAYNVQLLGHSQHRAVLRRFLADRPQRRRAAAFWSATDIWSSLPLLLLIWQIGAGRRRDGVVVGLDVALSHPGRRVLCS